MKTPERFNRAIKALVQAFFNDTLINTDCRACAVGNMVAAGKGLKVKADEQGNIIDNKDYNTGAWFDSIYGGRVREWYYSDCTAKDNVMSTGYNEYEIAKIENAFMKASGPPHEMHRSRKERMEWNFEGLMAVVEVLCEIEGLNSEEYKEAFSYTEDLKPVNAL